VRIGLHTSIAGALERSAITAGEMGANTFQIFSSSPRQWKASVPSEPAIKLLNVWREKYDLTPLIIHDNYLINLASSNEGIRKQSIEAFRGELVRGIAIGAEYLVAHPGNYKGQTIEEGIFHFLQGVAEAANGLEFDKLMLLVECTAGAGAQIGGRLEELHIIREYAAQMTHLPVGFCLDTCHLLVSGYNIATEDGLKKTIADADRILGLEHVRVIHANDSKTPLGSHVDRHEHIGQGYIGLDGFRRILTHPKLRQKAFILETPVDKEGDEQRNLDTLKALWKNQWKKKSTTTTKSS
jgi:deoxyribonuclease IV